MLRHILLTMALIAGSVSPLIAEDQDKTGQSAPAVGNPFTMENAREHLLRQGYTGVSELVKDESGRWVGTATKDGKNVPVAVDVKGSVTN